MKVVPLVCSATGTRHEKYLIREDGFIFSTKRNKFLMPLVSRKGYLRITLMTDKERQHSVHRLVLCSFVGFESNDLDVNHKDFNRKNNYLENLQWCSRKDNIRHSFSAKRIRIPPPPSKRLTQKQVDEIRRLRATNTTVTLGQMYGIASQHVSKICLNQQWKKRS